MNVLATKLASTDIGEPYYSAHELWVDDNVGEAVHIHFRNVRIDLSVNDYYLVTEKLKNAQEKLEQYEELD